jgi:multiple sugar transport system ATP-binding protein
MAELEVRGLGKRFGGTRVLQDISFDVEPGEFCILLGPSGCGKSTVLRLVAGLDEPDGGTIRIGGRDVAGLSPRERDVAMVFQSYALYTHMTVYDNLAFPLRVRRAAAAEVERRVRETADFLGIGDLLGRKPAQLSGGQRQRVALGRALVRSPRLFLFDEPLSNLDARLRASMRIELANLHRSLGAAMLYVTHDQVEAMTLGQKVILLHGGRIQQMGGPRELYERPANVIVAAFIGSPGINLMEGLIVLEGETPAFRGEGLLLPLPERPDLKEHMGASVTLGVRPEALAVGEGPLRGDVELVEHVGAEAFVHVRICGTRVTARVGPDLAARAGDSVSFSVKADAAHIFLEGGRLAPPCRL